MKTQLQMLGVLALLGVLVLPCRGQVAAPASLPTCLIQYVSSQTLTNTSSRRLTLYKADNTYVEINAYSYGNSMFAGPWISSALHQGTYTYTVDALDPTHATIAYDGGGAKDQLYFVIPTSGRQTTPVTTPGDDREFTLYPEQNTAGGANVSNRCELAAGGTAITGFVVQGDGPRWVLLRAAGSTLAHLGVTSATVAGPSFTLYNSQQAVAGVSAVWSADPNLVAGYETIFALVGAFPFSSGSDEGVLLVALDPGVYTAVFKGQSAGQILCEAYILPF
ncbi:hypothetical protein K0B96_01050 [Horticoccus luteus]|uniref:Uncharacterized protein n=1 Tax=Horticoccus luteus TaxID=2862869 RepID=A0A8F9TWR1_9BACT|nr:hypothetical protein [Horticoccus luteus]QYM79234.1 hypothetical protein K0B96_01050 [Horticoccus luteus]